MVCWFADGYREATTMCRMDTKSAIAGGCMSFGRFRASVLAIGMAGMLGVLSVVPGLAASSTVVVTPASLAVNATSWYFYDDTNDVPNASQVPGKYEFVTGPGTPPAG